MVGRDPERGRNLRSIEHTEPATRSGSHVEEPATLSHARHDELHKLLNLRYGTLHNGRHLLILSIDVDKQLVYRLVFKMVVERGFLCNLSKHNLCYYSKAPFQIRPA